MDFTERRRQPFLTESHYRSEMAAIDSAIAICERLPARSGRTKAEGWMLSSQCAAFDRFQRLCLKYTAGEPIEPMREELGDVVAGYERYGERLWACRRNPSVPVFDFNALDDYCALMQLVGLCFLLRRRDLVLRIARLQDGEEGIKRGEDRLFEEFMRQHIRPEDRVRCRHLCHQRPYDALLQGLTEYEPDDQFIYLERALGQWYDSLSALPWHDSHRKEPQDGQAGYFGYWSFETGAVAMLLDVEDDTALHRHLHYPKDLVAWTRSVKSPTPPRP